MGEREVARARIQIAGARDAQCAALGDVTVAAAGLQLAAHHRRAQVQSAVAGQGQVTDSRDRAQRQRILVVDLHHVALDRDRAREVVAGIQQRDVARAGVQFCQTCNAQRTALGDVAITTGCIELAAHAGRAQVQRTGAREREVARGVHGAKRERGLVHQGHIASAQIDLVAKLVGGVRQSDVISRCRIALIACLEARSTAHLDRVLVRIGPLLGDGTTCARDVQSTGGSRCPQHQATRHVLERNVGPRGLDRTCEIVARSQGDIAGAGHDLAATAHRQWSALGDRSIPAVGQQLAIDRARAKVQRARALEREISRSVDRTQLQSVLILD